MIFFSFITWKASTGWSTLSFLRNIVIPSGFLSFLLNIVIPSELLPYQIFWDCNRLAAKHFRGFYEGRRGYSYSWGYVYSRVCLECQSIDLNFRNPPDYENWDPASQTFIFCKIITLITLLRVPYLCHFVSSSFVLPIQSK